MRCSVAPLIYTLDVKGGIALDAVDILKMAYKKHVLNDESIGWDELGENLADAICNIIGADGFTEWLKSIDTDHEP